MRGFVTPLDQISQFLDKIAAKTDNSTVEGVQIMQSYGNSTGDTELLTFRGRSIVSEKQTIGFSFASFSVDDDDDDDDLLGLDTPL